MKLHGGPIAWQAVFWCLQISSKQHRQRSLFSKSSGERQIYAKLIMLEKLDSDVCYEGKSSREGRPRVRGERGSCLWFSAPQSRRASGEKVTFEQRLEGGESESQDIWRKKTG